MYLYVRGVEFVSFCDFLLDFRTGIFIFAFHFITRRCYTNGVRIRLLVDDK